MQRYPGIDPPEYAGWRADAAVVRAFREQVRAAPERRAVIDSLDQDFLIALYEGMVRFRLHDYALKRWVRRGVISKAWLGTGEEAITIGSVHALERDRDVVAPMIRNAGACHEMGMALEAMFASYLGTTDSPARGFDLHVGDPRCGVISPISPVGEMVPVITGIALAFKRHAEPRVALTWIGDGATKTGAVHEGLNLAGALGVPAVFILQNNQVALGTRLDQHQIDGFDGWPAMYGMPGSTADGNNVLDVLAATRLAALRARAGGGPSLVIVDTFRMGGHATHDEAEARRTFASELFEEWGRRDPIGAYEEYLVDEGVSRGTLEQVEARVIVEVEAAADRALASREGEMPAGETAEWPGFSAGVRQPGLAARIAR